jgi:phage gp36-like protein
MAFPYISQTDLENRAGAHTVLRCCDDDSDGIADAAVVTRILTDASSVTRGHLIGVFDGLDAIATTVPSEVLQLTLDVAVAMLAQRAPEVMRMDGERLRKRAEADLIRLRENHRGITGHTAENEGGYWGQGDPDDFNESDPPDTFTANGFGDF